MASAEIIDGKAAAAALRADIAKRAAVFAERAGRKVGLAVVLVGEDPASEVYVRNKIKATAATGMDSHHTTLPAAVTEAALLDLVDRLNDDPSVDGILVQLPLPAHLDSDAVIQRIHPDKDVDGLTVANAGRLLLGLPGLVPCTPQAALRLITQARGADLSGLEALVIGRSNLFGKPMTQLLLAGNCTVTQAHSRTRDLAAHCARADLLIAAVGQPRMIAGDWVKPGATVIDVGINRIPDPRTGKTRLVGDVDFDTALSRAGAITPVPGGVGPMTIACLMANALAAAALKSTEISEEN